jgi:hypothetical protein
VAHVPARHARRAARVRKRGVPNRCFEIEDAVRDSGFRGCGGGAATGAASS